MSHPAMRGRGQQIYTLGPPLRIYVTIEEAFDPTPALDTGHNPLALGIDDSNRRYRRDSNDN